MAVHMLREAMCYTRKDGRKVLCLLCRHNCLISDGAFGICGVRENRQGTLYTHAYGDLIAAHIDPIEKKPIFHLLPGSRSYSIAAIGCNFHCGFCQNWQISQAKEARRLGLNSIAASVEDIVSRAEQNRCRSISYTYTEPTIFFEYAYEASRLAKERGLYNIFVTNGYMTDEALELIRPYLDAANVDLKAYSDDYYKKVCGAKLEGVLASIRKMKELGFWIEITTLVLPGMNDSKKELESLASFIAGVGVEIPWHISRFHPDYKMTDLRATPIATMEMAQRIGKDAGLRYVYPGNLQEEENTYCRNCGELLIQRLGFSVLENRLRDTKCPKCGTIMDGCAL